MLLMAALLAGMRKARERHELHYCERCGSKVCGTERFCSACVECLLRLVKSVG